MMGKHSQEALKIKQLEETIELKEKEIKDKNNRTTKYQPK